MPVGTHPTILRLAIESNTSMSPQMLKNNIQKFKGTILAVVRPSLDKLESLVSSLVLDLYNFQDFPYVHNETWPQYEIWVLGALFMAMAKPRETDAERDKRVHDRVTQLVHIHAPVWEIPVYVEEGRVPRPSEHELQTADIMSRLNAITSVLDTLAQRQGAMESALHERRRSEPPRKNREDGFTDSERILNALTNAVREKDKEPHTDSEDETSCRRSVARKKERHKHVRDRDVHLFSFSSTGVDPTMFFQMWQIEVLSVSQTHRPKFDDDARLHTLINTLATHHKTLRRLLLSSDEDYVLIRTTAKEFDNVVEQFFSLVTVIKSDVRHEAAKKFNEALSKDKQQQKTREGHCTDYRALIESCVQTHVVDRVFRGGRGRGRGRNQFRGAQQQYRGYGRAASDPATVSRTPPTPAPTSTQHPTNTYQPRNQH
jgi:hypothetical protein